MSRFASSFRRIHSFMELSRRTMWSLVSMKNDNVLRLAILNGLL
jgi:hypothetical protein